MTRYLRPGVVLVGLVLAAGCGTSEEAPELGELSGTVISLNDRAPVSGARLVLVDPSTNAPSSPLVETDSNGRYRITGVPAGWHYLVAYAVYADRQLLYDLIESPFHVTGGARIHRDLFMDLYRFLDPGNRTVTGRVVDAVTGDALSGAYVSIGSSDLNFLFSGTGFPWETVTDGNGLFSMSVPIKFGDGGTRLGLYPLLATRAGYRPGATGSRKLGEWLPLDDTLGITIRLQPGSGTGRITGRVLHEGGPVARVPVGLSIVDTSVTESSMVRSQRLAPRAALPDLVTTTDALGTFDLGNVPRGFYRIQAAYYPDDGWFSESDESYIETRDGGVSHVDLNVLPAVSMKSPLPGEIVDTAQPRLRWRSLAGADTYRIAYSLANDFRLTGGFFETPDTSAFMRSGVWGDGDHARWAVYAYQGGKLIGGPETIYWLQIDSR